MLGDPGRQGGCGLSCCALPGGPSILQKWSRSLLSLGKIKEWFRKASGLPAGLRQGCLRRRRGLSGSTGGGGASASTRAPAPPSVPRPWLRGCGGQLPLSTQASSLVGWFPHRPSQAAARVLAEAAVRPAGTGGLSSTGTCWRLRVSASARVASHGTASQHGGPSPSKLFKSQKVCHNLSSGVTSSVPRLLVTQTPWE